MSNIISGDDQCHFSACISGLILMTENLKHMKSRRFYIWKDDSIKNVQDKFSELFPQFFLKIFINNYRSNYCRPEVIVFRNDVKMDEINPGIKEGSFLIRENMSVSELKEIFYNRFGLEVQILKRNEPVGMKIDRSTNFSITLTSKYESDRFP